MANETKQSLDLESNKNYITQNKDILTKKIRWDNYLKGASYVMYSLFVGLLSLSFLFSGAQELDGQNFQYIDLVNIFIGLLSLLISIGVIAWIYKGSLKKLFLINYYFVHLFNALFLSIISIVMSLAFFSYPISGTIEEISRISELRSFSFGIGTIVWFIVGGLALFLNIYRLRGTFPVSWLKLKLSMITLLILPILASISLVASLMPEMKTILLLIQLGIFVLGFLYSAFAFSYIKSFKELILSDKTEQEIQKIDFFRNISFLFILMPSLGLIILGLTKIPLLSNWSNNQIEILSLLSIIVDALILIAYLTTIIFFKKMGRKSKGNKLVSSIDNLILMDFLSWFLLLKTTIIVGLAEGVYVLAFIILSSCFISIFIINIFTILIGVNFPNIKNTTSTIINMIASMAVLGMILFQSTFPPQSSSNIFESVEIVILTMLPMLIAFSLNLGIKIFSFSRIKYNNIDENSEDELNNNVAKPKAKLRKTKKEGKVGV